MSRGLESEQSDDDRTELERDVERLTAEIAVMKTDRGELEAILLRTRAEAERLEAEFKAAGGRHWETRDERRRRIEALEKEIEGCEARLVACAATELPLGLVGDLLERVERQDEREQLAAEAGVIVRLLTERDERLVALLGEFEVPPGVVRKVKSHLARDRESRHFDGRDRSSAAALPRVPVSPPPVERPEARGTAPGGRRPHGPACPPDRRAEGGQAGRVDHARGERDRRAARPHTRDERTPGEAEGAVGAEGSRHGRAAGRAGRPVGAASEDPRAGGASGLRAG